MSGSYGKNIRLQFIDGLFNVFLLNSNIPEQIRLYLKNHTNRRGRFAISHNLSCPRYNLINNNDIIDVSVIEDNETLSRHIIFQGFNLNYFTVCGNTAAPSHLPIIDV